MPFDLSELISQTGKDGAPLQSAHFQVRLTKPSGVNIEGTTEFLSFYTLATNLPGVGFELMPVKRHGYGLEEKRPVSVNFNQIGLNVLVDGRADVIKFFQKWFEHISKFRSDDENYSLYAYPDTYETTLEIIIYDSTGNKKITYKMLNAWPATVEDVSMAWDANEQFMIMPINIVYKKYLIEESTNK